MSSSSSTLHNGVGIPSVGPGVFQTPPEESIAAVQTALAAGYRHVDTAAAHGNERDVAEGVQPADVDALDTGVRGCPEPEQITREAFGLQIPGA